MIYLEVISKIRQDYTENPDQKSIIEWMQLYFAPNFETSRKMMQVSKGILDGKITQDKRRGYNASERVELELRDWDGKLDNDLDDLIIHQLSDINTPFLSAIFPMMQLVGKDQINEDIEERLSDDLENQIPFKSEEKSAFLKLFKKFANFIEEDDADIEAVELKLATEIESELSEDMMKIAENYENETDENKYILFANVHSSTVEEIKLADRFVSKMVDYIVKTTCQHEYRESLFDLLEEERANEKGKNQTKEHQPPKRDGKDTFTSMSREQTFILFKYLQKSGIILDKSYLSDSVMAESIYQITGYSPNTLVRKSQNEKEDLEITQEKLKKVLSLIIKDLAKL
jgi:hypothetical protein